MPALRQAKERSFWEGDGVVMPLNFIHFDGEQYPSHQADGNAARWITPFALQYCQGRGCDVGCNREEWALPGSIPVDPLIDPKYDCFNLPAGYFNFLFSSHMLEHIDDWVGCLDYWKTKLYPGGWVFLYLPHYSQKYWRPWNNRKHKHAHRHDVLRDYFTDRGWINVFPHDTCDANNSFVILAQKPFNNSGIGIYEIVNIFNNKKYVGSTVSSFYFRFNAHKSQLSQNKHHSYLLQRAYNKYGNHAFKYNILEDCSGLTEDEIHDKETEYINKFDSANAVNGYNIKKQSTGFTREVFQKLLVHDIHGNFIAECNSSIEVSKIIDANSSTIQASYKRQSKGIYSSIHGKWIVVKKDDIDKAVFDYPYTIYEIDDNGNEIDSFYKFVDAGKKFNIGREGIRRWIKYNTPTPNGTFLIVKNKKYPYGRKEPKSPL